jgi:hypothetical protein
MIKYATGVAGISIYPVPNSGNTIFINGITNSKNYKLSLLNQSGAIISTQLISAPSVDLPEIPEGFYILRLYDLQTGETENLRYIKLKSK